MSKRKNLFEDMFIPEDTKKKIERNARRQANIDCGITPYKSKVHKNKKLYSRADKHKTLWEVE
tara:strand:- start:2670 stop:2858 length:189 start_codon:yes stop_codon:yes gene_type:complete